jgi:probable rRNA maturation factor
MASSAITGINFFFKKPVSLNQRKRLKKFMAGVFSRKKLALEGLNYVFCSDKEILEINHRYLNHDYYTDILSFSLGPKGGPISGEIYISVDRVRENAGMLNQSISKELHRVMFHGILHLCGYKDKTKMQKEEMRKAEDALLSAYFRA